MESIASVFIVSIVFLIWLPLFLNSSGSHNTRHDLARNVTFLRRVLRSPRTKVLQKTG